MSQPATILIIDDNAMNLDMAKELLESAGYATLDAEDAMTGIELMKTRKPDMVLLDLLMPQVDGFEAIRLMKKEASIQSIPVIAFTALGSGADRQKSLEYGCQDIIIKPIDPTQVLETVQRNLGYPADSAVCGEKTGKVQKAAPAFRIASLTHKVLVVDDKAMNVDILREVLESMGQTVITAYTGESALQLARDEQPALILLDIMMPEMNGYVVLENLKANPDTADIPVIIVSALNRTEDRVKGLVQGAIDYISKPFEFEEIKARISAVLRTRDLQDELKKQRDQLATLNDSLAAVNKELGEFTTIASHDLQAPLRKIITFSELLQKSARNRTDSDHDVELLQRIQASASKMQALIQDLLALSRAGYRGRELKPVDLSKVAQDALRELGEMKRQTGAEVHIGDLPVINADEVQIRQLFSNLLSNAMKFRREGVTPVVKVASTPLDETTLQLTVEDNGPGFSEEQAERIFKAFERLHGVSEYEGTGIGLNICKKVVERHGGTITAQGKVGEGSVFTLVLPVGQPSGAEKL